MNEYISADDIRAIINNHRIPTILMWNRLEGRPRTRNFDRALKAEIRDALFMLTKQWQMGEFKGDDAGSPVVAKVNIETTQLNKFNVGTSPTQFIANDVPLEVKAEQRRLPFTVYGEDSMLDIRLFLGRQWLKMTNTSELAFLKKDFINACPIKNPERDTREDAVLCAHIASLQQYAAVAGRAMDGAKLYSYLKEKEDNHAYDLLTDPVKAALIQSQKDQIVKAEKKFIIWFEKLFYQPVMEGEDAWQPSKLEYKFTCSAPKDSMEKTFTAEEYYHGHLDWYNLNTDRSLTPPVDIESQGIEQSFISSSIPTQIQFEGMPNTRWWAFEDGKTNFGDIKPDTTDLNKLLLMEFGLIYANDWFLMPFTLPVGSIANIKGIAVTNVFGERIWIKPAGAGNSENWQRWGMFTLNVNDGEDEQVDLSLLLLSTASKIQESQPIEEVYMIRDEMANMVWGIETRILLHGGISKPGREAAVELQNYLQNIIEKENADLPHIEGIDYKTNNKYKIMSTVPENWIPFIPVHVKDNNREIQLQRGAMPRIIEGDSQKPVKVRPRTYLLSVGLDQEPKAAFKLYEEEVPRAGVRVYHSYRRTRWYKGKVVNWLGARKQTGRGEGWSNLHFDELVDK